MAKKKISVLILHNIRSAINVGAIFRTADAVGISHIYISGYTPTPIDKFARVQKDIAKSALGAEKSIPWTYSKTPTKIISNLKKEGFQIIGIEQDKRAKDYRKIKIKDKTAFLLGNEVSGMSESLKNECDTIAEIAMLGEKESLNVSVAFGIAVFRILNV